MNEDLSDLADRLQSSDVVSNGSVRSISSDMMSMQAKSVTERGVPPCGERRESAPRGVPR